MVKSRISALFGQKFHPKFPDQRRDCDDHCKCGYFPTDCSRYGHPGVDLKWDPGWKVTVCVGLLLLCFGFGLPLQCFVYTDVCLCYQVFVGRPCIVCACTDLSVCVCSVCPCMCAYDCLPGRHALPVCLSVRMSVHVFLFVCFVSFMLSLLSHFILLSWRKLRHFSTTKFISVCVFFSFSYLCVGILGIPIVLYLSGSFSLCRLSASMAKWLSRPPLLQQTSVQMT